MSARNRKGICAYCGQEKKLTTDHVPPKLLFAKPCPANMLTVPACSDCNKGFKNDDEYSRTVLALDLRSATHRDVIGSLPAVLRSLQYPDARGFAQYLGRQAKSSGLVSKSGATVRFWSCYVKRSKKHGLW